MVEASLEHQIEGGVFEALSAGEFPTGLGHLLDQEVFVIGVWLELGANAFEGGLEFVASSTVGERSLN